MKKSFWGPLGKTRIMKILIIGNSHATSLKLGWESMIKNADPLTKAHQITFFAARGKMMLDLEVKSGGRLRKSKLIAGNDKLKRSLMFTSNGKSEINVSEYDVCLVHGMVKFPRYDRRTSSALKNFILKRCSTHSIAAKVSGIIRDVYDIPIYLTHQPIPAWDTKEFQSEIATYATYDEVFEDVKNAFPFGDVEWVKQPKETLENVITTKRVYAQGSIRLQVSQESMFKPHRDEDLIHMNGDYGLLQLNAVFNTIKP